MRSPRVRHFAISLQILACEVDAIPADVWIFHAGTKANPSGQILTNGGRVLAVTAVAPTLKEAQALAYKGVDCVHFEGKTFRRDIAYK